LEKHKGCDILDINPGAGLWSQKLHEYLKPRRHVLLEPSPAIFAPFLDPLLEVPGSKYKLVSKDPLKLSTYREIAEDGTFPHQTRVDPNDPKAQEVNNTLLVIGSLAWDPRLPGLGFDSMSKQLFHHFASAAWANDLFHAFGPVRSLFWVQTEDFDNMIAKAANGMGKASRLLEMTQDLNIIVTSERQDRKFGKAALGREPQYEIESIVRALQSTKKSGVELPANRQDISCDYAALVEDISGGSGIISFEDMQILLYNQQMAGKSTRGLAGLAMIDTIEFEKKLRSEFPTIPIPPLVGPSSKTPMKGLASEKKIVEFRKMRTSVQQHQKTKGKVEAAADIGEEMYLLECKALKMKAGPRKDKIMKQIENLDQAWDQAVDGLESNFVLAPITALDDRLSLRHPPHPRIQWDRRPFEPLVSQEDEVWPLTKVSLVSATPFPRPVGDSSDWHEWVLDFVNGLYNESSRSLPFALDSMAHGLSAVIEDCPSLTDPDRGGRMQMKHFRVRMLTNEMILELAQAYKDWPFKAPGSDHNMYFRSKGGRIGT
jgi:transcription factor 1